MKSSDTLAEQIVFGVELETIIPANAHAVGYYHGNTHIVQGRTPQGQVIIAPVFNGAKWRADADGSIRSEDGFVPCEYVSPRLHGIHGVESLIEMIRFINAVGAKVNKSCGCHITIGLTGTAHQDETAHFIRRLVRITDEHTYALYAQTGTDRHRSGFCSRLPEAAGEITNQITRLEQRAAVGIELNKCGRGLLNLLKASDNDPAIEFRCFAGTTKELKVLHHLSTCLGLVSRASRLKVCKPFRASKNPETAPEALHRLWQFLGWTEDIGCDVAHGLFGQLHSRFNEHANEAVRLVKKFDKKYPRAFCDRT